MSNGSSGCDGRIGITCWRSPDLQERLQAAPRLFLLCDTTGEISPDVPRVLVVKTATSGSYRNSKHASFRQDNVPRNPGIQHPRWGWSGRFAELIAAGKRGLTLTTPVKRWSAFTEHCLRDPMKVYYEYEISTPHFDRNANADRHLRRNGKRECTDERF